MYIIIGSMNIVVNVVIVCWNAYVYTENTIYSIEKTLINSNIKTQLTIINNGSIDNTKKFLKTLKTSEKISLKIIHNYKNIGIGAAYNQGLQESMKLGAKYTVFANNDLQFTQNWLEKMVKIMDSNKSIAVLSPLRPSAYDFYDKNRSTRDVLKLLPDFNSPEEEVCAYIGKLKNLDEFSQKIQSVNYEKYKTKLRFIEFPGAVGSSILLTRTNVFEKIGFFANSEFREYGGEDIDMCWRVMKLGYRIAITNDVYVHHFRGKSIKFANVDRDKMLNNSNQILYKIWHDDIISFLKEQNILRSKNIPNTPEFWLLNELKDDIDFDKDLLNEKG